MDYRPRSFSTMEDPSLLLLSKEALPLNGGTSAPLAPLHSLFLLRAMKSPQAPRHQARPG